MDVSSTGSEFEESAKGKMENHIMSYNSVSTLIGTGTNNVMKKTKQNKKTKKTKLKIKKWSPLYGIWIDRIFVDFGKIHLASNFNSEIESLDSSQFEKIKITYCMKHW